MPFDDLIEKAKQTAAGVKEKVGDHSDKVGDAILAGVNDINDAIPVIDKAGYTMSELEIELGVPPKLIPHFTVNESLIVNTEQSLIDLEGNTIGYTLLKALIKAKNNNLLVNNDCLVENVHFNDITICAQDLGWKAVVSNISDLLSSGSTKTIGITISLILPGKTEWVWVEDLYKGINKALKEYGGIILGGDCSMGNEKMISITALGIQGELELRRNACKPNEIILTTGIHGLSKLGFMMQSKINFHNDVSLNERLISKSIKHFCRPQVNPNFLKNLLKTRFNKKIKKIGCTDSSDGLFQAVQDLAIASNCQAIINNEKISETISRAAATVWLSDHSLIINGSTPVMFIPPTQKVPDLWSLRSMINATPVGRRPTDRTINDGRENAIKKTKVTPIPRARLQLRPSDDFDNAIFST